MRETAAKSRPRAQAMRKAMTKAEVVLWSSLRLLNTRGFKFRRQHPIGPYIADFVHINGRLVIEIDGATHWSAEERAYDERRTAYLNAPGWRVVRVLNEAVYADVGGVVEYVVREVERETPPHLIGAFANRPLPRAGEVRVLFGETGLRGA